jgi:hypothetical protein
MTIEQYIKHHQLYNVGNAIFPSALQHKFANTDEVEYFADAASPNRIVAICRDRNYAAVFRQQSQSLTNVTDLNADIPDLNKST